MNPRSHLAPHLVLSLCGLGGLSWFGEAPAQTAAPNDASGSNTHATAAAYQDRLIDGGSLPPDVSTGDEVTNDPQGLARTLQIDGVANLLSFRGAGASTDVVENGVIVRSQWETATYGAWSLDAAARTGGSGRRASDAGQGGVVSLRQRGMPFDGGWQADNAVGDINSPNIALARVQSRFYLPTGLEQGATTDWHGPSGLQLIAGAGVPGYIDGIQVPDFHTLGGTTATAGAQWSPAPHWTLGGQFIDAHDVKLYTNPWAVASSHLSSNTGLLSAAWADHGANAQLNLLDGATSGNGNSLGTWVDASIVRGKIMQNFGAFRIDPNLTWGDQPVSSDTQGGYYRFGYQSRRWQADVGIDAVHSVSGLGSSITFVTGDARYQLSRDWGIGSFANLSHSYGTFSESLEGYVDHLNRWGVGSARASFAKNPTTQNATFTLDQGWPTPNGTHLTTSASIARISGTPANGIQQFDANRQDSTALTVAASGGGQLTTRLSVQGNLQWATTVQGRGAPGVSSNVSLVWQLSNAWSMLATYYDTRIGSYTPLIVTSPLTPPLATIIPAIQQRGVFLTIRYQRASGSHFAPLGGGPGSGSGEIAGMVFLDANNNGRADAGEAGAANVTVVLDGRFSVQTDPNGRFSFPMVATGTHAIAVVSDNLPLPWTLTNDGRVQVQVSTRNRSDVSIAAQRLR